jgi:hypothetical protein
MLKIDLGMAGTHPVTKPIPGKRRATCIAKSHSRIRRCRASFSILVPCERAEILVVVRRESPCTCCRDCVNGLETGKPSAALRTTRQSELTAWSNPNAPTA